MHFFYKSLTHLLLAWQCSCLVLIWLNNVEILKSRYIFYGDFHSFADSRWAVFGYINGLSLRMSVVRLTYRLDLTIADQQAK